MITNSSAVLEKKARYIIVYIPDSLCPALRKFNCVMALVQ